jgi:hypothetical protein
LCENNQYRLSADQPCEIRVAADYNAESDTVPSTVVRTLKTQWPYKAFSTKQASQALNVPIEKARDILKSAVDQKKILRIGFGRSTLFRIAK